MALEAYETLQIVRDGMKNLEFASLPTVVKTAQGLTKDLDRLTNSELAGLIAKDPFATAAVLENSNKGNKADSTDASNLEEALLKLGYQKLKQIVSKLLDMEGAKEKLRYPEQVEASAEGLCSCILAEEIYKRGFWYGSKLKMEDLYTATILRSYGRILMSSFAIDTYRTAMSMVASSNEKQAFTEMFGITPVDMTREILKTTKLPKETIKSLKEFDPSIFQNPVLKQDEEYMILAEFSLKLTVLLFDYRVTARKLDKELDRLLSTFNSLIKIQITDCTSLLEMLNEEIIKIEAKYEIETVPQYIPKSIQCRLTGRDLPAMKAPPKKKVDSTVKPPEDIINAGLEEIEFSAKKRPLALDKLYNGYVTLIHTALRLDETILFAENDDGDFRAVFGLGDMFKFVAKRVTHTAKDNNLIGLCAKNDCDALVFDTKKETVKPKIPDWMLVDNVNSVFVMYLKLNSPILLCAMRRNGQQVQLPGPVIKALSDLKRILYLSVDAENYSGFKTSLDLKTFNALLKG